MVAGHRGSQALAGEEGRHGRCEVCALGPCRLAALPKGALATRLSLTGVKRLAYRSAQEDSRQHQRRQ